MSFFFISFLVFPAFISTCYTPPSVYVCMTTSATLSGRGVAVTRGNKVLELALWSRKLAQDQGWKIYTWLHNITYLYLR